MRRAGGRSAAVQPDKTVREADAHKHRKQPARDLEQKRGVAKVQQLTGHAAAAHEPAVHVAGACPAAPPHAGRACVGQLAESQSRHTRLEPHAAAGDERRPPTVDGHQPEQLLFHDGARRRRRFPKPLWRGERERAGRVSVPDALDKHGFVLRTRGCGRDEQQRRPLPESGQLASAEAGRAANVANQEPETTLGGWRCCCGCG
mmetsp:Transcript_9725/g.23973  ORF Transcript_9725/g.23973 Transcript_9725/m.23973 type:complete len:203 (+) Transcript_9725:2067-2675(+)